MTKKWRVQIVTLLCALLLASGVLIMPKTAIAEDFSDELMESSPRYLSDDDEFLLMTNKLPELDNGHWAKELFVWAMRAGIVHGYGDGSYQPDKLVNEAELLKMLYKLMGAALPGSYGPRWAEGGYNLANYNNLPAKGIDQPAERLKPVNRQTVAEIITGITGVHYTGKDAIRYLIGNQLIPVKLEPTLEKFDGEAYLTRAEALAWLRVLSLKGFVSQKIRPDQPSDRSLLDKLQPQDPIPSSEYFSHKPIKLEDLYLYNTNNEAVLKLDMNKVDVDKQFAPVEEAQDIFQFFQYENLSVGFNKAGQVDRWQFEDFKEWHQQNHALLTSQGIQSGVSTLFDVMEQYGTAGYSGNGILTYAYEMDQDGVLQPVTDQRFIRHHNDGYLLSFIMDPDTHIVWYVSVMNYQYAYYDFYSIFAEQKKVTTYDDY